MHIIHSIVRSVDSTTKHRAERERCYRNVLYGTDNTSDDTFRDHTTTSI